MRQYRKNEGRVATVKFKNDAGEYQRIEGVITGVMEEAFSITDEDEVETNIPYEAIVETKIIPVI